MGHLPSYTQYKYIEALSDLIKKDGMSFEVSTDFYELQQIRAKQTDRPSIAPLFDPNASFIGPQNGFWIKGLNAKGDVVHTQAMRCLDLSAGHLEAHLDQHCVIYAPPNLVKRTHPSFRAKPKTLKRITGNVVYHGDLWIDPSYRGSFLTTTLPRLAFAFAYAEWKPDYLFGFISPILANKGLGVREGYMRMEPGVWTSPGGRALSEEWLVWMTQKDMAHLFKFHPEKLYDMVDSKITQIA